MSNTWLASYDVYRLSLTECASCCPCVFSFVRQLPKPGSNIRIELIAIAETRVRVVGQNDLCATNSAESSPARVILRPSKFAFPYQPLIK